MQEDKAMTNKTPAVIISATVSDGFRRCGMFHPARHVTHPAGTFTEEQLRTLLEERMLSVTIMEPMPAQTAP